MARETIVVLNITSEIGHMMSDPSYILSPVKLEDIMNFFESLIIEQESSYKLKNSDINAMTSDINKYFDSVTANKNSLIAEESGEAAADLVAAAATIAAAAGSWVPFVNFALAATAVAATATALGLEIALEKLHETIVEEISNADTKIIEHDSFKNVKTYSSAVSANALFYPQLQLGATIKQIRALFIGVIVVIKKSHKGKCTKEDIKQTFLDYYDATQADPRLVDRYIKILQELDEGGDLQKFQDDMKAFLEPLPPAMVQGYAGIMLSFAASLAIRQGKVAYQAYKAALAVAPPSIQLEELDAEGNSVEESGAAVAETETLGAAEIGLRAMGILAGVASIVFAGLEIAQAVDTDKKLTKAISDAKSGITNYYTALVNGTIDGDGEVQPTPSNASENIVGSGRNIRVLQGVSTNKSLLSCTEDGSTVNLWYQDDNSGRQKWNITLVEGSTDVFHIKVSGGVNGENKYLSCWDDGSRVDLWHQDDQSGRQRWQLQ